VITFFDRMSVLDDWDAASDVDATVSGGGI
jgi:hypothetical protein